MASEQSRHDSSNLLRMARLAAGRASRLSCADQELTAVPKSAWEAATRTEQLAKASLRDGIAGTSIATLILVFCGLVPLQAKAERYRATELGVVGKAMNNAGEVVGTMRSPNGGQHAFRYIDGKVEDLGTLGEQMSIARAINASGDIVGDYGQGFQATQVFIYSKGSMKRLPSTSDSGQNRAISITDSGRVLINGANVSIGPRSWHVSTYGSDGKLTTTSELEGKSAVATGMNSSGEICGFFYTLDRGEHAFIFERGVVRDIGSLGGGTASANAINVDGAVVGRSRIQGGSDAGHAFLFHDNRMIDLGTLGGGSSIAISINTTGIIVGRAQTKGGSEVAFIFENGRMFDLNSVLEHQLPNSIQLRQATAINDSGQILAEGIERVGGQIKTHGYVLTPR